MRTVKKILAIVGSATEKSANLKLTEHIATRTKDQFEFRIFNDLKQLPHFDPDQSSNNPPPVVLEFRSAILEADGILICTPEYIFSIPSGLKNAIEWCIATTVFSDKPTALITASAQGEKGHEELQLIMKTAMARFHSGTTLLIQGIRGKMDEEGNLTDATTESQLDQLLEAYSKLVHES